MKTNDIGNPFDHLSSHIDLSAGVDLNAGNKSGLYDHWGNLKVVPFVNDGDGCSYWRIKQPFLAMGLDWTDSTKTLEQTLETCKAVTFNRMPGFKIEDLIKLKLKYGFKVILDWDDYWVLPADHLIYKGWNQAQMPALTQGMLKELADHVTCTTERLAEKIRPFNKNVTVIPNAIPVGIGQWEQGEREYGEPMKNILTKTGKIIRDGGTRYGYVAGSSHLPDLRYFQPILNHFPDLRFSLCGYNNPRERNGDKNVWDVMERIASNNSHNKNYRRVKTTDFDNYAKAYNHIDVAFAPLKKNEFNGCKSSLKAYEAGAKKVAFIATDCAPYTDDVPKNVATFCGSNAEWVDAIKAHRDLSFVKDQADKLYAWVDENRNLNKIAKDRLEFYNSII